jgi:hypothetical protein
VARWKQGKVQDHKGFQTKLSKEKFLEIITVITVEQVGGGS